MMFTKHKVSRKSKHGYKRSLFQLLLIYFDWGQISINLCLGYILLVIVIEIACISITTDHAVHLFPGYWNN